MRRARTAARRLAPGAKHAPTRPTERTPRAPARRAGLGAGVPTCAGEIDYEEFVSGMAGFMEDARMPSFMTSRMHRDSAWMTPKPLKFGAMLPQALGFTKAPVFGS